MILNYKKNNKVIIIAEIANAHEGKKRKLLSLVNAACKSNADIVKLQIYYAEELVTKNHPRFNHFKNMQFDIKFWKKVILFIKRKKLYVFADVFGLKAAKTANSLQVDGFKVHSSDILDKNLLNYLDNQKKPILLSCGGSNLLEIDEAIKTLKKTRKNKLLALMHGFQSYPTSLENTNLSWINYYRKLYDLPVGIMDHFDANNKTSIIIPSIAIASGASIIEKHITLNRKKKDIDYYSSLELREFKEMVSFCNHSVVALGKLPLIFSKNELNYRTSVKKLAVANKNLSKGRKLKINDFTFKRVRTEAHSLYYDELIDKVLSKDIPKDQLILNSSLKNKIGILIAVRLSSKRLPKKALLKIKGITLIEHLIERLKLSKLTKKIVLCTSYKKTDDPLAKIAKNTNIDLIRGHPHDVLSRFVIASKKFNFDTVVRITGDDILIDPEHLDHTINYHFMTNSDYTTANGLPKGTEAEVISFRALKLISILAEDTNISEYMTYYFKNNNYFRKSSFDVEKKYKKKWNLTIDYLDQYNNVKNILENVYNYNKPYNLDDLIKLSKKNPKLFESRLIERKKNVNYINSTLNPLKLYAK